MTEQRLSQLADMACTHIAYGRYKKALKIVQYIREYFGSHLVPELHLQTGQRRTQ